MIRLFIAMLLLASGVSAADELLTPEAFSERVLVTAAEAVPEAELRIVGELELAITLANGDSLRGFLDNSYAMYRADPENVNDVIKNYIATISGMSVPQDDGDLAKLVPVIKHADYLAGIRQMLSEAEDYDPDADFPMYFETLNSELVVMYAIDSDQSIRFLSPDEVTAFGLQTDAIRQRAVDNLVAILPEVSTERFEPLTAVLADGNYEATLLLWDALWTEENFDVQGDIVAFVPSRDILLVTGSEDQDGLATARDVIRSNEWTYAISEKAFVRRDGRWTVFED
ncbi:MAG: DUF1444 family protein [Pseudomonadota bacterium]